MGGITQRLGTGLLALAISSALSYPVQAGQDVQALPAVQANQINTTDRLIVKFHTPSANIGTRIKALGATKGANLTHSRAMSGGAHVARLGQRISHVEARALAKQLAANPDVAYVEPDVRVYPQLVPNDSLYSLQWHYYEPAGGINLPGAWDISTGSNNIVIAVIDTGVVPHADLAGRLIPGYDFISDAADSNDGDGRDSNANDPGDYGCNGGSSSWHGTHIAGTIGAASNNGVGVTGINWLSKILPVRVLGKCGGYTSDIVDAMRWAAGLNVPGVPANPFPARVQNLSFGGEGSCAATFQNAVDDVTALGTVVVVAAGNGGSDVANTQPASCNGVIAVAATVRNGGKASYSNFGAKVAIAAPGGGNGGFILSTLNTGTTIPIADSY
ncbi:MAG: S8 family peptidase, partial [Burkholderiales bacterium]|nr:S8 family peptidase [Burkholderiales bacterium]